MILLFNRSHIPSVQDLWKEVYQSSDVQIDGMSFDEMDSLFISQPDTLSYVFDAPNGITGFVSGRVDYNASKGFITIVVVHPDYYHNASVLLQHLEDQMLLEWPTISSLEFSFHNPLSLQWTSSCVNHPTHPMLPGIPEGDPLITVLEDSSYHLFATQEIYYKELNSGKLRDDIQLKESLLAERDIQVTVYNSDVHTGLDHLFNELRSPGWKEAVMTGLQKGYPLLVVCDTTSVIGFAGPLYVEPSGRGYFAGIGVDPNYRKQGIASVLFARLCHSLSKMNASYMTLFTGTNNPARYIYLNEGFDVIHRFYNYRKEIQK